MNIRKKLDERRCCATRCKEAPFERHIYPDGNMLWFCRTHGHGAAVEAGSAKIDIKIESLVSPPAASASTELANPQVLTVEDLAELEAIKKEQDKAKGRIAQLFEPDRIAFFAGIRQKAETDLAELHELELDQAGVPFAESERDTARAMLKELEGLRTPVTKPLNAILRAVNERFTPAKKALEAVVTAWTHKINDQQLRARAERQRLLLAAQQAAQAAEQAQTPAGAQAAAGEAREALIAASECAQEPEGTIFIDRYRYVIERPEELPREYLCPDDRKISAAIEACKKAGQSAEQIQIPGVRVWNDPIQRSRKR
jgi:hypothetical protein